MKKMLQNSLNIRQRKFVDLILTGLPAGRAYEKAGYKAKGAVADTLAARLLRNEQVFRALRDDREALGDHMKVDRKKFADYLVSVMMTPLTDLDSSSPLVQEFHQKTVGDQSETSIRMISKIEAAKLLATIMGWTKPILVKSNNRMPELIALIRKSRSE